MRKLFLTFGAIAALAACDNANAEKKEYESIFTTCEAIETTAEHVVYKCPADLEWVANIKKTVEPNGMFITGGDLKLAELYADTAHNYVEVALNNPGFCKEDYTIRTMVNEPTSETYWAVIGCR